MKNCPICNGSQLDIFKKKITEHYDLLKCNECAVIVASPFHAPASAFYTEANDTSSQERHGSPTPFPMTHPARSLSQLKTGAGKEILDIGCGNGAFASYVCENGFSVTGIDIDQTSLKIAKSRNLDHVTFLETTLDTLIADERNHGRFDVISMFEVFEHIDNPNATIASIKKLLKPEGLFIGSLPNISRLFMWRYNMNYEIPPYHLTYWTTDVWKKYAERNGFKAVLLKNNIYYGYVSDIVRIRKRIRGGTLLSYCAVAIKRLIEIPAEMLRGKGASFFFVLQKQK